MTNTATAILSKPVDPKAVAARTIGLALDCHRFGERRQGDLSSVTVDADKDLLNLTKHLVPRRQRRSAAAAIPEAAKAAADALRAVERLDFQKQDYLKRVGLPSYFKAGTHRISLGLVEEVDGVLGQAAIDRAPLVETFCLLYPGLIDAMAGPLGSQYRRGDYLPVQDVKAGFSFEWRWFELDGVPDRVAAVSTEAYRAAQRRLQAASREAAEGIRLALRGYLREIVAEVTGKLAGDGAADPKQFRQSTILANLTEFFRTFPLRNVTDDAELEQVVAQLQGLTSGLNLDDIKTDAALQAALRRDLTLVKAGLDDLLVDRGVRVVDVE